MILLASNEDGNISSNPPPAHSPFLSASAGPFGAVFPAVWGALWSSVSSGVGRTLEWCFQRCGAHFGAVFPAVWGALWSSVSSGVGRTLERCFQRCGVHFGCMASCDNTSSRFSTLRMTTAIGVYLVKELLSSCYFAKFLVFRKP